jgi:hypothetical protein
MNTTKQSKKSKTGEKMKHIKKIKPPAEKQTNISKTQSVGTRCIPAKG